MFNQIGGILSQTTLNKNSNAFVPTSKAVADYLKILPIDAALSTDHSYVGLVDTQKVGENVVFGDLLYFNWTDKEWKKAKADSANTMPAMRIALESKGDGEDCKMLAQGYIRDDSAFEMTGAMVYVSDGTAGAVIYAAPSDAGDQVQRVGIGISADKLYFCPSLDVGEI